MRVKVESISDGVEIHELDGEKVLGQDARLKTFKSQFFIWFFEKTWR